MYGGEKSAKEDVTWDKRLKERNAGENGVRCMKSMTEDVRHCLEWKNDKRE